MLIQAINYSKPKFYGIWSINTLPLSGKAVCRSSELLNWRLRGMRRNNNLSDADTLAGIQCHRLTNSLQAIYSVYCYPENEEITSKRVSAINLMLHATGIESAKDCDFDVANAICERSFH